jgi:hypothetical protein
MQQLPITVSDITMIKFEYNFSMHNTFNTGEMCHGTVGSYNRAFLGENLVVAPQIQHCVTGLLRYILYLIYIYILV